mgnify:CR=1 FL=1
MLLYLEGHSRREIFEVLHIPRRTVSGYISLYTEGGAEALLIRKQSGRTKFLTDKREKQDAFRQQFEDLKKLFSGEIDVMLFEDESMIRDYQAIMKTWFPVGKQRIIPIFGKHEGVKLVGFLDYETGRVYVEEHKKYDAEVFLGFF